MHGETRVPSFFRRFGARCTVLLSGFSRGRAGPEESLLNSEVRNREFRSLKIEIPKIWGPKTAQDCGKKMNGTLDWGIIENFDCRMDSKVESIHRPPLPKHCLLMWFPFPSLPCHSHAPCCCQCECLHISTAILKPVSQVSSEYSFCTRSQKTTNCLFPLPIRKDRFTKVVPVCLFSGPCFAPFK